MPVAKVWAAALVTEMVARACLLWSVTDVAVMRTLPVVAGAENRLPEPLAVCVGLSPPQAFAGAQLQVTPAFAGSLATSAMIRVDWLGAIECSVGLRVTTMFVVMVMALVLAFFVASVTEVAVMTTVEAGTLAGAV